MRPQAAIENHANFLAESLATLSSKLRFLRIANDTYAVTGR